MIVNVTYVNGLKGKRDTFRVGGKTLQDAHLKLAARPEFGSFQPMAGQALPDKEKNISKVILKVGFTISMPVWTEYKGSPLECRAEWDRMWKALEYHEEGHRATYLEMVAKLYDELKKISPGSINKAQLAQILQRHMNQMEANQERYDESTHRGRTEGVFLDPPAECQ